MKLRPECRCRVIFLLMIIITGVPSMWTPAAGAKRAAKTKTTLRPAELSDSLAKAEKHLDKAERALSGREDGRAGGGKITNDLVEELKRVVPLAACHGDLPEQHQGASPRGDGSWKELQGLLDVKIRIGRVPQPVSFCL